jgi:hypothetical protein
MLFFAGRPITESEKVASIDVFQSPQDVYTFAMLLGRTQDPSLGVIAGLSLDCLTFSAPASVVSVDDAGVVPDKTLVVYPLSSTGSTGTNGTFAVLNVQPGARTLTVTHEGTPVAHYEVWVEPACATEVWLFPDPS